MISIYFILLSLTPRSPIYRSLINPPILMHTIEFLSKILYYHKHCNKANVSAAISKHLNCPEFSDLCYFRVHGKNL